MVCSVAVHVEGDLALPWQLLPLWHTLAIIGDDEAAPVPLIDIDFEPAPLRVAQRLSWNGTLHAGERLFLAEPQPHKYFLARSQHRTPCDAKTHASLCTCFARIKSIGGNPA